MAWTQEDIDALKTAIKGGVKTVKYHDREVTYHSVAEMRSLLEAMQADVNKAAGGRTRISLTEFHRD